MHPAIIETDRLRLRQFLRDDIPKVFLMSQEAGMRMWIPDQVYRDEEEAEGVISFLRTQYSGRPNPQKAPYVLGIELKSSHELIGHVGLSCIDGNIEIGYAIENGCQGKGYATEAVSAMSAWAIDTVGLSFVLGIVASENKPSCRVLEKSGYILIEEKEKKAFGRECLCRIYKWMRLPETRMTEQI